MWVGFAASLLRASLEIPVAGAINMPATSIPGADYPTRPIRLVVPFPTGGADFIGAFTLQ